MSMENNAIARVAIIGGPRELTPEQRERQIINSIFSICYYKNRDRIDMASFQKIVKEIMNDENSNIHTILEYFDSLEQSTKEEIIEKCTLEKAHINYSIFGDSGKTKLLSFDTLDNYIPERYIPAGKYDNWTDEQLKKAIKRSKNPLEKQGLQRELGSRNFMEGKHRKGKGKR